MSTLANYQNPGKHTFIVTGEAGDIEVELLIPEDADFNYCALIGHPHSLHGGTMHNKVVTSTAAVFNSLRIPSIKFNFRGVGKSHGEYDAGIGESVDMLLLAAMWQEVYPLSEFICAGFSFGSFVAYRAASKLNCPLITIAPSVVNYNYKEFSEFAKPWLVIQGEEDEVVDPVDVYNFVASFDPPLEIMRFADTTHFFHGKLVDLKAKLNAYLTELLATL